MFLFKCYFVFHSYINHLTPLPNGATFELLKNFLNKYSCTWWNWSTCKEKITRFPYWFIPNICPLLFSSGNYLVPLWESIFNSTSLCNYSHRVHVFFSNWDKILRINIRLQDRKLKIDLESVKIFKQYCTVTLYLMRR